MTASDGYQKGVAMRRRFALIPWLTPALLAALTLFPALARADGTGVALNAPVVSAADEGRDQAAAEGAYQTWLAGHVARPKRGIGVPFYYLVTPSHRQQTGYYCGPATAEIIDDFWGDTVHAIPDTEYNRQHIYAEFSVDGVALCPSSSGTNYSLLDNCLRSYTGKQYYYYGGVRTASGFFNRVQYGLYVKHYPESLLVHIDPADHPDWSPYVYVHLGHIVVAEAFDWHVATDGHRTMRLNDPYSEADAISGGGDTYGHHVYHRMVLWWGVSETASRAMVY